MAELDKTIPQLDPGNLIRVTDDIPVFRDNDTVRVRVGSAAHREASDPSLPKVASVATPVVPGHLGRFTAGGGIEDGGAVPAGVEVILDAQVALSLSLDDYTFVMQGNTIYRVKISDLLDTLANSTAYTDADGNPYTDAFGDPYTS